jgi:hypothetical protein
VFPLLTEGNRLWLEFAEEAGNTMKEALLALFVFVCLLGASLGVLFFHGKLPAHYRHDDTLNVVRLIANIFVVMTSLVLGLMINSAKKDLMASIAMYISWQRI